MNPRPLDIDSYDYYLVMFSGGKDSTAAVLYMLDLGIPKEKIELWHHCVDGQPGSPAFMDWECTEDYCRAFAEALELQYYPSWLRDGFKGEMLRNNSAKQSTEFFVPEEEIRLQDLKFAHYAKFIDKEFRGYTFRVGGKGKLNTRMKFPQVSLDLSVRWCSAYLKRDVSEIGINNQKRFIGKRTLVITGERAEEGSIDKKTGEPKGRAKYPMFEKDRTNRRVRYVDHFRPVHRWEETQVWEIIERYHINVHPCYHLGFGRCSCKFCIFGNENQFASASELSPDTAMEIAGYERHFGTSIKRKEYLPELIARGIPYEAIAANPDYAQQAISYKYTMPILISPWKLPAGAYGDKTGPT